MPLPPMALQERRPIRCRLPRAHVADVGATLEFDRFQVLLRRRELLAEGVPIELGTRAFDLLMVLLQADGALVTKEELLSLVWPSVVVAEENLKVQIAALRKALGESRDFIRTEFGRGYRFTAAVRSTSGATTCRRSTREWHRSRRTRRARRTPSVATNETARGSFQASDENGARSDFGPRNRWPARFPTVTSRCKPTSSGPVPHASLRDSDVVPHRPTA
jgi:DNA-binding winged helix-turn-helix (wHTH) protein